jgi:hypothetical protein
MIIMKIYFKAMRNIRMADVNFLTFLDIFDHDRRESVTPEADIPAIFKTTLHVSIKSNSLEVIKLLLKYGIDPNYPSTNVSQGFFVF